MTNPFEHLRRQVDVCCDGSVQPRNRQVIVSFSGGRTSARFIETALWLAKKLNFTPVFVFMDTGAEHPETYRFIKQVVEHFGISLICLRFNMNPEMGKRNLPHVVDISEIGPDLYPWKQVLAKYGPPGLGRAWCTARMKQEVVTSWADSVFGKGGWESWIGIRADEPNRYFTPYVTSQLKEMGFEYSDMASLIAGDIPEHFSDHLRAAIMKSRETAVRNRVRFMAEFCDDEKQDVIDFWAKQPFDLGIPEWLGNCVFCFKKSVTKVAMAAKDEPELAEEFCKLLESPDVRSTPTRNGNTLDLNCYRGRMSLRGIIEMYKDVSKEELRSRLISAKHLDTGSCSESCEVYNEDTMSAMEDE